jgi:hypothetical protein
MSSSKTVKMSILLDSSGQVVGASHPSEYRPTKAGEEAGATTGMAAGIGQSMVDVEVPADLADLQGSELLSRLAEQSLVRAALASLPTVGEGPTSGGSAIESSQSASAGTITAGSV